MMLIGKTANWLLRHSVQCCVQAIDEFVRMRGITRSVKVTLAVLLQSFSSTSIYCIGIQKLSI